MQDPLLPNEEQQQREMMAAPNLRRALLWERKDRDPIKYYEIVAILGIGSMGSVAKVRKRGYAIGGSARDNYVRAEQGDLMFKLRMCWVWCCGDDEEEVDLHGNLLEEIQQEGPRSTSAFVTYNQTITHYAMKTLDLTKAKDKVYVEELKNEVEILKTLDHPNIICALETFHFKSNIYVIMEHCSGGDLYVRDPYTEEEAARIVASVLSAIAYMHSRNIIHRDLKFENIMYTDPRPQADVKVIDFGLSKKYGNSEVLTDTVGTVYTMSPEVFDGFYTSKVDIWSVGVITYMLLSSALPFCAEARAAVIRLIRNGKYSMRGPRWKQVSRPAKEFVKALLQMDPTKRPTAEEAMKMEFLVKAAEERALKNAHSRDVAMDIVQASIELYATYSTLKKLALVVVAHKSSSDEIGFLRNMFQNYNSSQNGAVDEEEFKMALKDYNYTDEELRSLFNAIDIDGTGHINYYEFLAATIEAHGEITEQRLAEAFDRLDSDDSGYITVENLGEILGEAPKAYLDRIVEEADEHPDDKIYYHEFLNLWKAEDDERRKQMRRKVSQRRLNGKETNGRDERLDLRQIASDLSLSISNSRDIENDNIDASDKNFGAFMFQANKSSSISAMSATAQDIV